jgi:uncharacterized protein
MEQKCILITGGSGLIGTRLTKLLLSRGYSVRHLTSSERRVEGVECFRWDPVKGEIDERAFQGICCIVHLAGAKIGEKRWTTSRRLEIADSRIRSAEFLFEKIKNSGTELKSFISASAVGYYGTKTSDFIFREYSSAGEDFLGYTCRMWEEAVDLFSGIGIRTVKIRTGVVLDKMDSALTKMMMTARFGFIAKVGSGRQYMPWIHIDDLCNIYLKAIEDSTMEGAYNAVAPQYITHREFVKALAKTTGKFVFPINIPGFILRIVMGEMAEVVLKGSRVSGENIIKAGYKFEYGEIGKALKAVMD